METADSQEQSRLHILRSYAILDTPPETEFDRLTRLAARICETPIATVTLIGEGRQWFKSIVGLDVRETDRAVAICAHTIQGTGLFMVADLRSDARFAGNPLVVGKPDLRFYAGVPLISPCGFALGALAVMDRVPRTLTETQIETVETLAVQVMVQLELRRQRHLVENLTSERERMSATLLGQSRNLLQIAGRITGMGGWAAELAESRVVWSDEVCEIHDVAPGFSPTLKEAMNFYASGSRQKIKEVFDRCVLAGTPFDEELQIITAKWRLVWVRSIGQAVRDPDGVVVRVHGALQDITKKKQAEEEVNQLANKLTTTLESITDAFFTLDSRWRFTYLNKNAEQLLQRQHTDLLGKMVWEEFKAVSDSAFDRECRRAVRDNCTVVFEEFYPPLDLWLEVRAYPSAEGLAVYFRNVTERRRAYEALRESEQRFKSVANATADAIWDWDLKSDAIWWSAGMQTLFGFSQEEIEPDSQSWTTRVHPDDKVRVLHGIHAVIDGQGENWTDEYRFLRKGGSYSYVLDRGFVIRDSEKRAVRMVGGMTDLTAHKQSELDLARLNRALRMRSAFNELLIRAEDETELLAGICRLALDIGGYRMAWVGYAEDDEHRSISIVAQAGDREDATYVAGLRLSWSDGKEDGWGQGPAGRTIRSGLPLAVEDITKTASFTPWQVAARQRGYRGVIFLPLRNRDRTFGLMVLYCSGNLTASNDEINLLQALADELSFGIDNTRSQDERRRIQSAVLKVAVGVSASTGTEFFEHLARNMAEAVGAQAGFVTRLLPGMPLAARTIAAVIDGVLASNYDYVIEGTPCEFLLEHGQCVVPAAAAKRFTGASPPLSAVGAEAYVGRRLDNSLGQPVGLLFVLFCEPLKRTDFVTSTLQIFAARAAGELERQEADARIRNQASLLDKAQDAIVVRGIDHCVTFWNKGAERLYGWTAEEAIGRSAIELLYGDSAAFSDATNQVLGFGEWSGEISQRCKDGHMVTIEGRWALVKDDSGVPQSILAINTDITQRKAAEQKIQHLAFYDPLTLLPNRLLLLERLQHAMTISARTQHTGALLFIDLDNFKTLNDTLGHDKGDLLLQQVALRLASCVRESDTVARLGGDEFVVMLENLGDSPNEAAAQAKTVGEKILTAFNQPYQLAGYEYHSTPSVGATLFNDELSNVDELLKRADLAMYQAKAAGRNALRFFDPEMQAVVTARASLETDLRRALQENEFLLHYQPQVAGGGRIMGAEALVRWQHPQRGLVSPAEFIPLAEETGLILPLGQWVLRTACAQLVAWVARPETVRLSLAVNVSARQFRRPDFVEQLLAILAETGADPGKLKLELTESLLLDNVEDTIAKMTALKTKGVGFSLDDFGTGYSSLSYLKRLPLDQLKIDQSFVRDVLTDPNDASIARTIVALGQSLGLEVIAEGVETEAQREFLARHNCHAYQGYLFSRPLPAEQFKLFMQRNTQI